MIFFHQLLLLKALGFSVASSVSSPSIAQNPPTGNALTEYKVSLPCFFRITGPIPKANSLTCTPHSFAATKCPSSCGKISITKSSITKKIVIYLFPFIKSYAMLLAILSVSKIESSSGFLEKSPLFRISSMKSPI